MVNAECQNCDNSIVGSRVQTLDSNDVCFLFDNWGLGRRKHEKKERKNEKTRMEQKKKEKKNKNRTDDNVEKERNNHKMRKWICLLV